MNQKQKQKLQNAVIKNDLVNVKKMLTENTSYPNHYLNNLFFFAVDCGYFDIVEYLIGLSKINIQVAIKNSAFVQSCFNCTPKITALLLKDPEIDPSYDSGQGLIWVAQQNQLDIAKIILKDKRLNPNSQNNTAIIEASYNDSYEMIQLLWNKNAVKNTLKNDNEELYNELMTKDIRNKIEAF